jgi:hypothetical protein
MSTYWIPTSGLRQERYLMPRNTPRLKNLQMINMINKVTGFMIPIGDMRFSHKDRETGDHVYKLRMPVSLEYEEIRIRSNYVIAKVIPQKVLDLVDYYMVTRQAMSRARDIMPLNQDLTPLSEIEVKIFGVRENQPNKLIPRVFYGIDRRRP